MTKETAMKILKELHDNSLFSNRIALEVLIPELADSNDERIRKCLINFFEDWHENRSHCWGIAVTSILAWLEKQKSVTCNTIDSNNDEKIISNDSTKELKKINSYCQENCKGYQETGKCFADGECDAKRKAEQESAAWSYEDEEMLRSCTGAIWAADYYLYEDKQDMEAWLKRLKDRIGG